MVTQNRGSVVLNVSPMSQGDVYVYLLSSKEPTSVKSLGTVFTQRIQEKGESDAPLPVLMY